MRAFVKEMEEALGPELPSNATNDQDTMKRNTAEAVSGAGAHSSKTG